MLQPKRLKFRKFQRGRMKGAARSGATLAFGDYALQAQEPCYMTARQIEAARRAIVHHLKRGGKVWIRVFPDKPITKKPAEVRMGSGKGAPDHWVAVVRPGRILFELSGVDHALAKEAMRLASHKLPIKVKFLARDDEGTTSGSAARSDSVSPERVSPAKPGDRAGDAGAVEGHAATV